MRYHEGGWIVFSSLESKRKGILTWRYEGSSEAIEEMLESSDDPAT